MAFLNLPLLDNIRQHMNWQDRLMTAHTENMENADRPGYKAYTLKPFESNKHALNLENSHQAHLGSSAKATAYRTAKDHRDVVISGNAVSLEHETGKLTQTAHDYMLNLNVYRRILNMFKMASTRS